MYTYGALDLELGTEECEGKEVPVAYFNAKIGQAQDVYSRMQKHGNQMDNHNYDSFHEWDENGDCDENGDLWVSGHWRVSPSLSLYPSHVFHQRKVRNVNLQEQRLINSVRWLSKEFAVPYPDTQRVRLLIHGGLPSDNRSNPMRSEGWKCGVNEGFLKLLREQMTKLLKEALADGKHLKGEEWELYKVIQRGKLDRYQRELKILNRKLNRHLTPFKAVFEAINA